MLKQEFRFLDYYLVQQAFLTTAAKELKSKHKTKKTQLHSKFTKILKLNSKFTNKTSILDSKFTIALISKKNEIFEFLVNAI